MKTVRISNGAAELLRLMAQIEGVSARVYLEALLHYAGSCSRRPGSWEAARPFAFEAYDERSEEGRFADRWFDADRQYAFDELGRHLLASPRQEK
jgi:hypothetical protein